MKQQETCWCWLCFGITLCHRWGQHQHCWPQRKKYLPLSAEVRTAPEGAQLFRQPSPTSHACPTSPVNRGRFPGTSPGYGKRKFPAIRHLLTPSVEVFWLVAAPRVGRGVLLSHTLPGRPHRDPHTALGCWGTCEEPRHGGRHPTADQRTCGTCALQFPCLDGQQEPLLASRV